MDAIDPTTLLSAREQAALAAAEAVVAHGGALDPHMTSLADWERQVLSPEAIAAAEAEAAQAADPVGAVNAARERIRVIRERQATRTDVVQRLRIEAGGPLDLDFVQDHLMRISPAQAGPTVWVVQLLDVAGQTERGPLRRLAAAVSSMSQRRDGHVTWRSRADQPYGDVRYVTVSASSEGGAFTTRRWRLDSTLAVTQDTYGELRVRPYGRGDEHTLTVSSRSGEGRTDYFGHVVGEMAVRWWMAYLAREAVRAMVSPSPAPPSCVTCD
ncbi:hypothetical protein [Sphaerisporangium sp. NPDC051011]|uniref:hypothetical protein n=1 Tax=Sphaerisporangium sp. NPDC051011 TaxID=3155792 RepID=UPI00340C807A